jgi:hypothetical protein
VTDPQKLARPCGLLFRRRKSIRRFSVARHPPLHEHGRHRAAITPRPWPDPLCRWAVLPICKRLPKCMRCPLPCKRTGTPKDACPSGSANRPSAQRRICRGRRRARARPKRFRRTWLLVAASTLEVAADFARGRAIVAAHVLSAARSSLPTAGALRRFTGPASSPVGGRVDEDVAILIPHSPGCAAFPRPVLHGRVSLAKV